MLEEVFAARSERQKVALFSAAAVAERTAA